MTSHTVWFYSFALFQSAWLYSASYFMGAFVMSGSPAVNDLIVAPGLDQIIARRPGKVRSL